MEEQRRHAVKAGDSGPWAEGQGKPQGVGKRWRGWYVGDDGKTRTKRFRTEAEAEGWANTERGRVKLPTNGSARDMGGDTFKCRGRESGFITKQGAQRKPKTLAGYRSILDTLVLPQGGVIGANEGDHLRGTVRVAVRSVCRRFTGWHRPVR